MPTTLIVCPCDRSACVFRKEQILELRRRGHSVAVATPNGKWAKGFQPLGAEHHAVDFCRFPSPTRDAATCLQLFRLMRRLRPDNVLSINAKAAVLGTLAAKMAGVERACNLFPGVGYAFFNPVTSEERSPGLMMKTLLRAACRYAERSLFVNHEDAETYQRHRLITPERSAVVLSEGIDLKKFANQSSPQGRLELRRELGADEETVVVLMTAARLSESKGTLDFIEASRLAARWSTPTKFVLAGPLDPECPDPVPEWKLTPTNNFRWLGWRDDVTQLLGAADVVTLPSYYREGVPNTLLEALASGRPVVTTDHVGCRETVDHGRNGFLTPTRDPQQLAVSLRELVESPSLRASFGAASLRKAQGEFCDRFVAGKIIDALFGPRPASALGHAA